MKLLHKFCVAILLTAPIQSAYAQPDFSSRFVLEDKDAVAVLPPELIASPTIKQVYYAPDGLSLVVLRERIKITPDILPDETGISTKIPEGEQELIYWSSRSRTARSIWKGGLVGTSVVDVGWFPQSDTAFIVLQSIPLPPPSPDPNADPLPPKADWKLLKVSDEQFRPTEIAMPDPGLSGSVYLFASNKQPLMMLQIKQLGGEPKPDGSVPTNDLIYFLRRDGRLDKPLSIPDADNALFVIAQWDKAGNPALFVRTPQARTNYTINPQTLALTPIEGKFEPQEWVEPKRTKAGLLSLRQDKMTTGTGETKHSVPILWLESSVKTDFSRLLLSGEATNGVLRPAGDGVFYQSQEALWFAPFMRLNQTQFLAARRAALRALALSNAKQAGTGLIMYAQDYDEVLPSPEGIKDKILPYIKEESVMESFTYTYGGGKLADIEKPAETVLGYVLGPGGRAIVYADGHAKWQDDKPSK
jgi:hypothetical protein